MLLKLGAATLHTPPVTPGCQASICVPAIRGCMSQDLLGVCCDLHGGATDQACKSPPTPTPKGPDFR